MVESGQERSYRPKTILPSQKLIYGPKSRISAQEGRRDFVLGAKEAQLASLFVTCE